MPPISAVGAVVISLTVLVVLGTIRLAALSHPDNNVSKALLLLY